MVLIIGGGLSGLLTGYLLKKEGIPFKILEARNRVGGRIHTIYNENQAPLEMGATWFNAQHKQLLSLLEALDIAYFKQYVDNTVFYQSTSTAAAQLVQIPSQEPSYRISGGTSSLINALLHKIDEADVLLNQSVKQIKINTKAVQVTTEKTFEATAVVLAIPPKLWAKNIDFNPQLPTTLMRVGTQTQTWMEDAIKVAFTYDRSFWGNGTLPGTLFSNSGPINELYDHSNHKNSKHALCGFIDSSLKTLSYKDRRDRVIKHLKSVFGDRAEEFTSYEECVWSDEENTFQPSEPLLFPHQNNGNPIFSEAYFDDTLFISSSESSSEFAGYMEGAVNSANMVVEKIKKAKQRK